MSQHTSSYPVSFTEPQLREGDANPRTRFLGYAPLDRLMLRTALMDNGCWEWLGAKIRNGYGSIKDDAGHTVLTHRLTYTEMSGPIPDDLELDHLCRVRACVNPAHLEPVTHRENVDRGLAGVREPSTNCPRGHLYDAENTYVDPGGDRECRQCRRAQGLRHRATRATTRAGRRRAET